MSQLAMPRARLALQEAPDLGGLLAIAADARKASLADLSAAFDLLAQHPLSDWQAAAHRAQLHMVAVRLLFEALTILQRHIHEPRTAPKWRAVVQALGEACLA